MKLGAAPALLDTVPILLSPLVSLAEKDFRASRPPMEKERSVLVALLQRRSFVDVGVGRLSQEGTFTELSNRQANESAKLLWYFVHRFPN